ncbi:macrophage mannose receptor 1-like isoform X2 [Saccostrea echinata]|uniref:macrophage mannose receptor 1-like isoform X2 n=1 Tax=Saccostrea echinata TaxID=191078 RepID=UPI002A82D59F|nr:macrophage mannose receptor 1-like isoform X2 [Saccostrea echinata]
METFIFIIIMLYLKDAKAEGVTSQNITRNNVTKQEGESAIFVCNLTGNNFTNYKWFKNEKEILKEDRRLTISQTEQGGKLFIERLKLQDIGWYACEGDTENQAKWFLLVQTDDCYRNTLGRFYIGKVNVTISGRICQPWGSQVPHKHRFGWLYTEENYCRNPDDESAGPWCYTMDKDKRWESCGIQSCSDKFDPCSSTPCQNGGECNSNKTGTYICTCRQGWTGETCKERVPWSSCNSSPCKNGGTCIESEKSFTCQCSSAYIGPLCAINLKTDLCDVSNFWNHYGTRCYKVFDTSLPWEDAVNICRFMDAELPVVTEENIQQALTNISSAVEADLWTGISSYEGVWFDQLYNKVNLTKVYWSIGASISPTNKSCIVVKDKKSILNWVTQDCKVENFFACSRPEGTCPSGWIFHQRYCYRYINTLQTSWYNAKEYCQNLDSTLLDIQDFDRQIFIHNFVQRQEAGIENDNRLWLDLKKNSNGQWIWDSLNKQPVYTNWANDTEHFSFDCAYIDAERNGKWFNSPCTTSLSTMCYMEVGSSNWRKNVMRDETQGGTFVSECGDGWRDTPNSDSCYMFKKEMITWSAAEDTCVKMGAHLISIDNAHEQGYITGFLQSSVVYNTVWIGANTRSRHNGFRWSSGSPFVFYNWFPGQPDGQSSGSEECVSMFSINGKWSDVSCGQKHYFICEKIRPSRISTTPTIPTTDGYRKICPDGWKSYRDHCFLIERKKMSWGEASQFCRSKDSYLATIADQDEQNFLFSQLPSEYCFNFHPNDTHCSEMAAMGKCTDDLLYMVKQCPAACKQCSKNCSDSFNTEHCQSYAAINGCENNPEWMLKHCRKTCGGCNAVIHRGFWIGLKDAKGYLFAWENHEKVSFTLWKKSEPQGYLNYHEGCTAMTYNDGLWFDQKCNMIMPGLICKAPKQKEGITVSTGCDRNYVSYTSMCYKFSSEKFTWSEAQSKCQGENGHLATVSNVYVQAFLSSQLIRKTGNFWIGYKETRSNDTFMMWNSGQLIKFRFGDKLDFSSIELSEACATMTTSVPAGIWSFKNCTTRHNFICEKLRDGYTTTTLSIPTTPPLKCQNGWSTIKNFCYKVIQDKSSWTQARSYCQGIGADLASIHSDTESRQLHSLIRWSTSQDFWIGLNDREKEGDWQWSDGTPLDYTKWLTSQPDNWQGKENCATYRRYNRGFNDLVCSSRLPFICKVEKGVLVRGHFQPPPLEKCDDEEFVRLNHSCFNVTEVQSNFHEAQRICREKGAELASIHSEDENSFISDISSKDLWIGLVLSSNAQFAWTDGTPLDFTFWAKDEPNNYLDMEACSHLKLGGVWNDNNCGNTLAGFVCKKRNKGKSSQVSTSVIKGGCPKQFVPSPYGSKCYKLVDVPKTWSNAKSDCSGTKGASLLSIRDQKEQDFVIGLLKETKQTLWIGLRRFGNKYLWENNQEVTYTNWDLREPTQSRSCVEMQSQYGLNVGKWKTVHCSQYKGYICEALKDPSIATHVTSQCPPNYVQNRQSCYRFFNDIRLDWESADHHCRLENGTLAAISTVYEFGYIQAIALQFNMTTFWIGLRKSNASNLYQWSNGLPYLYSNWNQSEPSQRPGEDCVLSHNNKWQDRSCKINLPYLCEKNLGKLPLSAPLECPKTGMAFNGACYYIEMKQKGTWTDAQHICQNLGMTLASIHSAVEMEHVREFAIRQGATSSFWIGLSRRRLPLDPIGEVNFYWSDKSTVDYTNWNTNEPSDSLFSQNEECVEMATTGTWNDVSCRQSRGFVCRDEVSSGEEVTTSATTAVYFPSTSADVDNSSSSDNSTFSSTIAGIMQSSQIKSKTEIPKFTFAIIGVVVGLLLLAFAVVAIAFVFKKQKLSTPPPAEITSGFENAMYRKDSGNIYIRES